MKDSEARRVSPSKLKLFRFLRYWIAENIFSSENLLIFSWVWFNSCHKSKPVKSDFWTKFHISDLFIRFGQARFYFWRLSLSGLDIGGFSNISYVRTRQSHNTVGFMPGKTTRGSIQDFTNGFSIFNVWSGFMLVINQWNHACIKFRRKNNDSSGLEKDTHRVEHVFSGKAKSHFA